jgi:conjugal transfer mating pair stabilization protein TraG
LIRTIAFEAGGENELGKAAVAHVVLNRVRSGKWGSSVEDVVTSPWQFEPWMTRRKELEELHPFDPRFQKAARIADAVLAGDMPDPTAGATHFLNPVVVRQRRGGSLPLWARRKGQPIGRHVFYAPDNQDEVPASDDATRVSAAPPARVSSPAGPG